MVVSQLPARSITGAFYRSSNGARLSPQSIILIIVDDAIGNYYEPDPAPGTWDLELVQFNQLYIPGRIDITLMLNGADLLDVIKPKGEPLPAGINTAIYNLDDEVLTPAFQGALDDASSRLGTTASQVFISRDNRVGPFLQKLDVFLENLVESPHRFTTVEDLEGQYPMTYMRQYTYDWLHQLALILLESYTRTDLLYI